MEWKKIANALLFPPTAVRILLTPVAAILLIGAMVFIGTESAVAYVSYVLAAYTLTIWCMKIPDIIRYVRTFKKENRYARKWLDDARLRVKLSLYGSLTWNAVYALFQLWLGLYHRTFWFCSLGAYYICLCLMRIYLVIHTKKYAPGEKMRQELIKYRACGWIFLLMNVALSLIIFFMVYWGRTFNHHMITTIAMAAFTFTTLSVAIVNVIKYRKYNSPVFSASKAISLAAALVSMLTLESTMLTTFGGGTMTATAQKWMIGATGGVISLLIVAAAIHMIIASTKKLKLLKSEVKHGQ